MPEGAKTALPRRDWLILPLLALLTALAFPTLLELGARVIWQAREDPSCDLSTPAGDRNKPNCTAKIKLPEGPWVENTYNECGYRSGAPCGPKQPNTIRIALLGSSTAEGFLVPFPQTFAARTENQLTRRCGRPVEIQNLAVTGIHPLEESRRLEEALALQPDAVFFLMSPKDLSVDVAPRWDAAGSKRKDAAPTPQQNWSARILMLKSLARQSTAFSMIRYYYFRDDAIYLRRYLETSGEATGYLQPDSPSLWRQRFDYFDSLVGTMASRARAAGVPFVLISSVMRPQAALLDAQDTFPKLDPFAFDRQIASIAEKHGVPAWQVIDDFRRLPRSTDLFYIADGHLNAAGHRLLSEAVVRQVMQSQILAPAGCPTPQLASR